MNYMVKCFKFHLKKIKLNLGSVLYFIAYGTDVRFSHRSQGSLFLLLLQRPLNIYFWLLLYTFSTEKLSFPLHIYL